MVIARFVHPESSSESRASVDPALLESGAQPSQPSVAPNV